MLFKSFRGLHYRELVAMRTPVADYIHQGIRFLELLPHWELIGKKERIRIHTLSRLDRAKPVAARWAE
jgi:hypothetical protein